MSKAKIFKITKIALLTIFLVSCGGNDPASKNEDVNLTIGQNQIPSTSSQMIKMQDAAGANITGFDYDAAAVAASVFAQVGNTPFASNADSSEAAQASGFIVKYKADVASFNLDKASADNLGKPSTDSVSVMQLIGAKAGVQLSYSSRLAVGAHTYKSDKYMSHADALALASALKEADASIEYVEPDFIFKTNVFHPNDTYFYDQWGLLNRPDWGAGITKYGANLTPAWPISTGVGVKVAVLDTGYTDHPDLLPNILPGYDFLTDTYRANDGGGRDADAHDPGDGVSSSAYCSTSSSSWHGTHVAGTVAAVTNNNNGVAGVAFGAKIVPVRVLGRCGGPDSDISDGIMWAAGGAVPNVPTNPNPVKVINMSLGGRGSCSQTSQAAIDFAVNAGVTVVVSAGNSRIDASNFSPANCNGVIVVAATDSAGYRASFSNYGALVDIAAPGVSILSTLNTGTQSPGAHNYAYYSGTSMSAPHVAGVAALLIAQDRTRNHYDIEYLIKRNAYSLGSKCISCGTGLLDAYLAVTSISSSNPAKPVYRLNNKSLFGAYLFTAYGSERDAAVKYYNFGYEGVAFHVQLASSPGLSPVRRFRDKVNGAYLFSIYESEHVALRTTYANQFVEEGVTWYASKVPRTGWNPLYRFRNKVNGTYTFTAYESERAAMKTTYAATFAEEGIAYYIQP